jgi:pyruvate carboxylase
VIGFLHGELGDPPGGWPEPFRERALAGRAAPSRQVTLAEDDLAGLEKDRRATLNRLLFPGPARDFAAVRDHFGDVSVLDTDDYLYGLRPGVEHVVDLGRGVELIAGLEAIGEPDARGLRTVMTTLNGQLRPIPVRDRSIKVDVRTAERADPNRPGHVAAPFAGVVTLAVEEGAEVAAGQTVATIEAMKMEASITTAVAGTVKRLAIDGVTQVEGGDLVLVVEPAG